MPSGCQEFSLLIYDGRRERTTGGEGVVRFVAPPPVRDRMSSNPASLAGLGGPWGLLGPSYESHCVERVLGWSAS